MLAYSPHQRGRRVRPRAAADVVDIDPVERHRQAAAADAPTAPDSTDRVGETTVLQLLRPRAIGRFDQSNQSRGTAARLAQITGDSWVAVG